MRGNMKNMMKKMQKMQKEMANSQEELNKTTFTGVANDDLVNITMNGERDVKSVVIKEELVEMADKELLEDLTLIALKDVLGKIDQETEKVMGKYQNDLNIPGL